jgi:hypothetical protein
MTVPMDQCMTDGYQERCVKPLQDMGIECEVQPVNLYGQPVQLVPKKDDPTYLAKKAEAIRARLGCC